MFPNDDLKKDIQSWKFVKVSQEAAETKGFQFKEDLVSLLKSNDIDPDEVRIPVHYDDIDPDKELDWWQDVDSDIFFPVVDLSDDDPEVVSVLEFICNRFPVDAFEAFEILAEAKR